MATRARAPKPVPASKVDFKTIGLQAEFGKYELIDEDIQWLATTDVDFGGNFKTLRLSVSKWKKLMEEIAEAIRRFEEERQEENGCD